MFDKYCTAFYLDKRSLALFRIFLAIAIISCAINYLTFGDAWLNPEGLLPPSLNLRSYNHWSVFDLFQSSLWNYGLFILTILISILMAFGIHSQLCVLLLLILTISIENRFTVSGGTVGLRLGLLWSLFIPLGEIKNPFSKPINVYENKVVSLPTFCFFAKISIFYWAAFFNKDFNEWGIDNTAVYYSLWWGGLATQLGEIIREYPTVTIWLTRITFFIEFAAPIFLISTYRNEILRLIMVFLLLGMHLGIELTMGLEEFPFANFAIALAFLPSSFWNWLNRKKRDDSIVDRPTFIFSKWHFIPVYLLICVTWKNLHNFNILPAVAEPFKSTLSYLRLEEKWSMFKGGGEYLTFWPVVIARNAEGTEFDAWKWYIDLDDNRVKKTMPEHVGNLTPDIRWEKFITNITLYRGLYLPYQDQFLEFLCKKLNGSEYGKVNTITEIRLGWGWREVKGINKFGPEGYGELKIKRCDIQPSTLDS